jgi:hypothetical protein
MKMNTRYDSRYNSEYKDRIAELVEFILDKNYGEIILNSEISKILHYNIDDEKEFLKFKSTMSRVKNFLVDYGYILKNVSGTGYYILKPKQIAGHCYHTYIVKTQRLLDKSDRVLNHTDGTQLSEIRKEEFNNVLELNTVLNDKIWETIKHSGYYDRKAYYDSLED